ncbi:cell division protein FtsK [Actinoalloteichus hymeniacidonis]|uniref:cell division protein FtsK n=1 Tax=Actinoalloteichus hymeniacidonis TaxID=340345 RepID=UPI0017EEE270|nr:cell division protein FtsK [Actinoalloteichus hymeniacidonis]MBB5910495.1 S-DNA-T family DNA segregation ATPase FtsK/SpoIIIE [Actinoalloteichus hymeniacidonis]
MTSLPVSVGASAATFGPVTTSAVAAGLGVGLLSWYRGHPDSFDHLLLPRLRAARRRWWSYAGHRWSRALRDCDLTREHRQTQVERVPRILRVRSVTPSIDMVDVLMVGGQTLRMWQDQAEPLADALRAHHLVVLKIRPQTVRLVIERTDPFGDAAPIDAMPIAEDSADVDLTAVPLGETEFGEEWTEQLIGRHWLNAGVTGSGKGSLMWSTLRGVGPMIRDGLVRVRMVDPKGGMETGAAAPLFFEHSSCTTADGTSDLSSGVDVIESWRDDMKKRQKDLRDAGLRKFTVSRETPLDVLMVDELAMLSAYGDSQSVKRALRLIAEGMTQGRAPGFSFVAYVQEPTKEVVPIRDLFTTRICLALTSANHVNAVLGDGMLEAGALAHEIPLGTHAGVGFVKHEKSRHPRRVRAANQTDEDIAELVRTCSPEQPPDNVVPLRDEAVA